MSCRDFEEVFVEIARERPVDAAAKRSALAHAETCTRCAARYAGERELTAGLRAVAASCAEKEAPPRVEAALLAAFRAGTAPAPERRARAGFRPWWGWAVAAGTALLMIAAGTIGMRDRAPERPAIAVVTPQNAPSVATAPPSAPQPVARSSRPAVRPRRAVRRVKQAPPSEVATDFIPLVYDGNPYPPDGGQLVRVRLPRTALVSFGLPINPERASEPVKADVIVGYDGLARAIRFVH